MYAMVAGIHGAAEFVAKDNGYMLFWMLLLGSVAGCVLEGVWSLINDRRWMYHTCTVWGPFCAIYGIGAVVMYLLNRRVPIQRLDMWQRMLAQFVICCVAGDAVEFLSSLFQEHSFGSVSWDYTDHALNLFGRISLRMTVLWGVVGLLYLNLLMPAMLALIGRISGPAGYVATWLVIGFALADALVTVAALKRWQMRIQGVPARNAMERRLDSRYGDERMRATFPNMRFRKTKATEWRWLGAFRKG